MAQKSYYELLEIIGKLRDEYQPKAVIAAEEEFKKRNPPSEIDESIENKEKVEVNLAELPLDTYSKIFALFFPRPLRFLFDFELLDMGYVRQYKEWKQWTWIGVAFYFTIFVILLLIAIFV